jgi:uncharacterized protein (DUF1330 family)
MAAYFIVDIVEILDQQKISEYAQKVVPTVEKYSGRYIVRGGPFRVVEGDWQFHLPVVLEFPSVEQAERWYGSEDYRELKELRISSARANVVLVAGIDGSAAKH